MNQPLGEVFGLPASDASELSVTFRELKICRFVSAPCTKDKADDPLGVCSVIDSHQELVITCPTRFQADSIVVRDAAEFFFPGRHNWVRIPEVRLADINGKSAGNIDLVIALLDDDQKIVDFGSVEIQAVYISGNVRDPFRAYMSGTESYLSGPWRGHNYPRPDFLSSSRKRLIPQMAYKGGILQGWGKKQAVILDEPFFATLPAIPTCEKQDADLAWLIYRVDRTAGSSYELELSRIVYSKFADAIMAINSPQAGSVDDFLTHLTGKMQRI
jgi:hypothetical protein